jgi:hypothetical protein
MDQSTLVSGVARCWLHAIVIGNMDGYTFDSFHIKTFTNQQV